MNHKFLKKIWEKAIQSKKKSAKESGAVNPIFECAKEEASIVEQIRRALECPICTDLLLDPVGLDCGHTLCLHCLAHDFTRREDQQIVCCICRDGKSKTVSILRSMRDVVEAGFPTEMQHRRQTLTFRDKSAISGMYASLSKSPTRLQIETYLNQFRLGILSLILFLVWFFLLE